MTENPNEQPAPKVDFREAPDEQPKRSHALTAAILGGAAAATAGAVWSARAIARRNGAADGKPLNAIMKTAATACELGHSPSASGVPPPLGARRKDEG